MRVSVCVCVFDLLLVEVQQDEHLQCGDVQRPAVQQQLGVSQPRPLQAARPRVAQTVQRLTCTQHKHHTIHTEGQPQHMACRKQSAFPNHSFWSTYQFLSIMWKQMS